MVSKIVKISALTSKEKTAYYDEISVRNQLTQIEHENVLRQFGSCLQKDSLHVLVEYAPRGSLTELFGHYKVFISTT